MLILLGLLCCQFFAVEGAPMPNAGAGLSTAVITVDRAAADQWSCEREYNSNLNLPRAIGEVVPSVSSPVPVRGVYLPTGRGSLPQDACGADARKAASELESSHLFAGPRAVDYYIYRMRRLII